LKIGLEGMNDLDYKEFNKGGCHYEVFEFEGQFCHESKHTSATPQLMEVLGGIGESSEPERVMVTFRALEAKQTFTAFVELKVIRLEDHQYHHSDDESDQWNRKDAKKNKKFLGHLEKYKNQPKTKKPPAKPARLQRLSEPVSEWA